MEEFQVDVQDCEKHSMLVFCNVGRGRNPSQMVPVDVSLNEVAAILSIRLRQIELVVRKDAYREDLAGNELNHGLMGPLRIR